MKKSDTTPAEQWAERRRLSREDRRREVHELARELQWASSLGFGEHRQMGLAIEEFGIDKLIQVLLRSA